MAWIATANSLTLAAQMALPNWVRARGMSMYQMAIMGATAAGAAAWGQVATWTTVPTALALSAATGILVMALVCWCLISREVIPRLGYAVKTTRVAAWTAAGMFLAFWLPLNNGLRPEPIIALGILLTWCSVERGVATSRLLPVAVACIVGALTLFSGPTGIASIGALLVAMVAAEQLSRSGSRSVVPPSHG